MNMTIERFNSEDFIGYKQITTFYEDFSIAEKFGGRNPNKAIKDTFRNAFSSWKDDYKYLTELVMVLNWKSWRWAEEDAERSSLYVELYDKALKYAMENLKDEEFRYFTSTIN